MIFIDNGGGGGVLLGIRRAITGMTIHGGEGEGEG